MRPLPSVFRPTRNGNSSSTSTDRSTGSSSPNNNNNNNNNTNNNNNNKIILNINKEALADCRSTRIRKNTSTYMHTLRLCVSQVWENCADVTLVAPKPTASPEKKPHAVPTKYMAY